MYVFILLVVVLLSPTQERKYSPYSHWDPGPKGQREKERVIIVLLWTDPESHVMFQAQKKDPMENNELEILF
jgi:hypothetical protein